MASTNPLDISYTDPTQNVATAQSADGILNAPAQTTLASSNNATLQAPQIATDPTTGGMLNAPTSPAGTAQAANATAATSQVNQDTDTVQGRVNSIINENSPLMQQAARRAAEAANSRGLLNSSLAVESGQRAVLDAATPIASADAGFMNQQRLANQQATQQTNLQNAQLTTDVSAKNATATNQLQTQNVDNAFKIAVSNADASTKVMLEQLGDQTKTNLANIEADYKTLIQTSASASDMYRQSLDAISKVVSDTNMNAQAKATAINGYMGWLKNALNLVGSVNGVDLGDLLNFGAVTA